MNQYDRPAIQRQHRRRAQLRRRRLALAGLALVVVALVVVAIGAVAFGGGSRSHGLLRTDPLPSPTSPPVAPTTTTVTTVPAPAPVWRVAWGSSMAWGYGIASNATIRDLATVAVGGSAVRFRISNAFGNQPLAIGAATVGVAAGGPAIQAGTLLPLTFNGSPAVTVPIGQVLYSDPVTTTVAAGETFAVSLWVQGSDLVSVHPCCYGRIVSYYTPNYRGNLTSAPTLAGAATADTYERFVDAADVLESSGQGSIVVVGDSITDGYNTTLRWTHVLQQRIDTLPPAERRAVVNEGITANALTSVVHTDDHVGGGPSGISRFQRDALSQAGVSEVVLFLGTNDLWFGASAAQVIQGYQQVIAMAQAAHVPIVGVTLTPRSTSTTEYWSPQDQANIVTVDQWIRTSGAFAGVLDFAAVTADVYNGACNPTVFFPPYNSGDNLHPDPAGQTAMANSVNPALLGLPPLPTVPPLVAVTPTPGCVAANAA
ncbi:MAG: GDSL-type esterase/lipase family protein [Acidimicrobiales bacterium]